MSRNCMNCGSVNFGRFHRIVSMGWKTAKKFKPAVNVTIAIYFHYVCRHGDKNM